MKSGVFWLIFLLSVVINWAGNQIGAWYLTLIVGLILGLLYKNGLPAIYTTLLASIISWGGDLVWQSFFAPVMSAANMIAGVMGFSVHAGDLVVVLTMLFGILLALAGTWLGHAIRSIIFGSRRAWY